MNWDNRGDDSAASIWWQLVCIVICGSIFLQLGPPDKRDLYGLLGGALGGVLYLIYRSWRVR